MSFTPLLGEQWRWQRQDARGGLLAAIAICCLQIWSWHRGLHDRSFAMLFNISAAGIEPLGSRTCFRPACSTRLRLRPSRQQLPQETRAGYDDLQCPQERIQQMTATTRFTFPWAQAARPFDGVSLIQDRAQSIRTTDRLMPTGDTLKRDLAQLELFEPSFQTDRSRRVGRQQTSRPLRRCGSASRPMRRDVGSRQRQAII